MAKKSKVNNSIIFDIIILVIAGLVFAFLALPYVDYQVSVLGQTGVEHVSGYALLDFEANEGLATIIMFTIIFAGVLAFAALFRLLTDFGVFKDGLIAKIIKLALLISALGVLVMSIIAVISVPAACSSSSLGSLVSGGSYAVWYSLALQIVLGLGAVACVAMAKKK